MGAKSKQIKKNKKGGSKGSREKTFTVITSGKGGKKKGAGGKRKGRRKR